LSAGDSGPRPNSPLCWKARFFGNGHLFAGLSSFFRKTEERNPFFPGPYRTFPLLRGPWDVLVGRPLLERSFPRRVSPSLRSPPKFPPGRARLETSEQVPCVLATHFFSIPPGPDGPPTFPPRAPVLVGTVPKKGSHFFRHLPRVSSAFFPTGL